MQVNPNEGLNSGNSVISPPNGEEYLQ
jgi:hypothetical protein